ncbi:GlpM family protein [Fructilactobacillus hinvesii]|uniref:GlpM family protein n=1 Tax=Fructilactobacillus hinvesii TaxID=2940300 RepID=A0ABY5BUV3_9LACO|nr:GlpM family protein [Fructilactobacillus hinvesii]USS87529.1 GlpM family protein [Fructilactobacillus hinvesii]
MGFWIFLGIVIILMLLEEFVLTDTKYFWIGGIIPLIGTIGIIAVMIVTHSYSMSDLFHALIGIFVLLIFWGTGDDRHRKKVKRAEAERLAHDAKDE